MIDKKSGKVQIGEVVLHWGLNKDEFFSSKEFDLWEKLDEYSFVRRGIVFEKTRFDVFVRFREVKLGTVLIALSIDSDASPPFPLDQNTIDEILQKKSYYKRLLEPDLGPSPYNLVWGWIRVATNELTLRPAIKITYYYRRKL
jgi:hypothetical protein